MIDGKHDPIAELMARIPAGFSFPDMQQMKFVACEQNVMPEGRSPTVEEATAFVEGERLRLKQQRAVS